MLPYIKVYCAIMMLVYGLFEGGGGMFMYTFNNQYFMIKYLLSNV